jgi:alkanesulfonate monooxygenase SsuD/methylene tetrahydromethanopterin reductase-like flavin-dependent oxidoreductase (luciferase family)
MTALRRAVQLKLRFAILLPTSKVRNGPVGERGKRVARNRPLRIGLYIPNGVGYMANGVHRWSDILAYAKSAEEVGFDSVWVADHMLFRFPDEAETQSRWECWAVLSAIAAATTTIDIGPLVSCMSFRNPAHLAKIAETVDEISNGRVILAVGAGWHEPEYTAYGFPFDHRASRFEEGFQIVHDLLRTGKSDFKGTYYAVDDCEVTPRGPRLNKIPLIGGTNGERLLRITARLADGWNTDWIGTPDAMPKLREAVDRACEAEKRDPATLARSACVYVDMPNAAGRFRKVDVRAPGPESHERIIENLHRYAAEGLSEVMVWLDPNTLESVEEFGGLLARLDQ